MLISIHWQDLQLPQQKNAEKIEEKKSKFCQLKYFAFSNRVARLYIYFQTKHTDLCKFGRALQWRALHFMAIYVIFFTAIRYILRPLGLF
jgi:hypothetical protein